MRHLLRLALVLLAVLLQPVQAKAQDSFTGRVTEGASLCTRAGIRIVAVMDGTEQTWEAWTDARGRFELLVPNGTYRVFPDVLDFRDTRWRQVEVPERQEVDFQLDHTLWGTVRRGPDMPVIGATVEFAQTGANDQCQQSPLSDVTDDRGRYRVDGLQAGTYETRINSERLGSEIKVEREFQTYVINIPPPDPPRPPEPTCWEKGRMWAGAGRNTLQVYPCPTRTP